jgi:hypothetical protein
MFKKLKNTNITQKINKNTNFKYYKFEIKYDIIK